MTEKNTPRTVGAVLAGGQSRRMGGGDKPLLSVGGRPILARVIDVMRPQCAELILNANGDARRFERWGLTIVPDDVEEFPGPLAGVLAALDWAALHRPDLDWVVTVAGDSPFLPADLVSRLHAARLQHGTPLAQAESNGQVFPVNALWKVGLRSDLRQALVEENIRKVSDWTAGHGVASAVWTAEPMDPFFNANTPEDVAEAENLLARSS